MRLESNNKHPHGLTDEDYDAIFTKNKPIKFQKNYLILQSLKFYLENNI